jgi:Flp pilus assembly protein TadD
VPATNSLLAGKTDKKSPKLNSNQAAEVQLAMGRSLEKQGQLDEAMAAYREAARRDPKLSEAYVRQAVLLDRQGKCEEAGALYAKAIKLSPNDANPYCDRGYSLYLQKRWTEAERNLRRACQLDPNSERAHVNLGLVLVHNDRIEEALHEFQKGGCDECSAHLNVAFVQTADGHLEEAWRHCRSAVSASPTSKEAKSRLAELDTLIAKKDQKKEKDEAQETVQLTSLSCAVRVLDMQKPRDVGTARSRVFTTKGGRD